MKVLIVLISLFTLSCTFPVIHPKARPRRQLLFGGGYPFRNPITGMNFQARNYNPVINIPDPPRAPTTTNAPQRPPDCRAQEFQNPGALFLIPSSDPRGSPQAFIIPSLSGSQNASTSLPTQIFVLPPSSGQSFVPGGGQLVPPIRPESSTTLSGGQAPVLVVPGVFLTAPDNRPVGGVNIQPQSPINPSVQYSNRDGLYPPWSGQYPNKGGQYQTGGPPYPTGAGQYQTGGLLYPNVAGQSQNGGPPYPNGAGQYPSGGTQYPPWAGQYPTGSDQYPPAGGLYRPGTDQYAPEQDAAAPGTGVKNWE